MKPPEVHLWFGEWQDGAGNVIQYRLIASRKADHPSEQVDAYAVYWPTAAAHDARGRSEGGTAPKLTTRIRPASRRVPNVLAVPARHRA
jgi:hypothetical protein